VFRQIGGHLQRRIHRQVERQLVGDRRVDARGVRGAEFGHAHDEDSGRVVHRAAVEPREGQDGDVVRPDAAEGLVFGALGRLVADHVGIGAAQSGGAHGFVGVDHDLMLGRLADGVEVVVVHPLSVVVLAAGEDAADVAALDGVVAVALHQVVGPVHLPFVVAYGRRGFVVHHQPHALRAGVFAQCRKVEIGIGNHEVENLLLVEELPILPADVPALDQYFVESVLGCEVDVAAHVGRVGRVAGRGTAGRVVGFARTYGRNVLGVGPRSLAADHLPPDADVLHRMDPRRVLVGARIVEVQYQARGEDAAGVVRHLDRPPGGVARRLHRALPSRGVGCERGGEDQPFGVDLQVHARVVDQRRFVEVDVEPVVGTHLQRGLHRVDAVGRVVGIRGQSRRQQRGNFGQTRFGVFVLLGVVVARNPEGLVVARHGELRELLLDDEIFESAHGREFVAESQSVVVEPEADRHRTPGAPLPQVDHQFVVMVADLGLLAPYGLPGLVQRAAAVVGQFEIVVQRDAGVFVAFADDALFDLDLRDVQIAAQFESQVAGQDHLPAVVVECIAGRSRRREREGHLQPPVRGEQPFLRLGAVCRRCEKQCGQSRNHSLHDGHRIIGRGVK